VILLDPLARPVIAHRGASGSFPENTVLAFEQAVQAGADALEMDIRTTADGIPVVMHDRTVDRTTDGTGHVRQLTVAALRELDAGHGERIPLLTEVLERFEHVPLLLDIKDRDAGHVVREAIEGAAAERRVGVGSFHLRPLIPFGRGPIAVAASRVETGVFWAISRVLAGWKPILASMFSVPEYSGRLHVVDRRFVRAAGRSGRPVHVWTVDDPADARRLWTAGVCGIISNWPLRIVRARNEFL
jgi:glycerophosphoryl diester phosphodiesterase